MHVLWVIHYPLFGGPHNRVLRAAGPLAERGIASTVALPDEPGTAAGRLADAGIEVVRLPLHRLRATTHPSTHVRLARGFGGDVRRLGRLIDQVGADVVVVGGLVNPQAALAARRHGAAVVWQVIDSRTPRAAGRVMAPVLARLADTIQFGGASLRSHNFGDTSFPCPVEVLRPSVDTTLFRPSADLRAATRRELGVPGDALLVGTVANVTPQKGIEHFVAAAGLVRKKHPDAHFVVVGDVPPTHAAYAAEMRRRVEALGMSDAGFHFAGPRSDIETVYPALDVKAITSVPRSEGTTTTALEAMACEVPVVATDVGAIHEVIDDGDNGLLVPANEPRGIAEAMLRAFDDRGLAERLGKRGRERVEAEFSLGAAVDQQERILRGAARHRDGRG